jgi:uncharacterized OB-fold protein
MSELIEPVLTDYTRGFWEGTQAGELRMQRCGACGFLRYPNAPWCPQCLSDTWEWQKLSGKGTILSYLIFHQGYHPGWKGRLPYNVVVVQLAEGPRMFSNVLPLEEHELEVGMEVQVTFDPEGDFVIPRFVKTGGAAATLEETE